MPPTPLGLVSREALMGVIGRPVLTGLDTRVAVGAEAASPDWLNAVATRY